MGLKKLTVWFAANVSADSYGGVSRVMHAYSSELSSRGYECKIIVNAPKKKMGYIGFSFKLFIELIIHLFSPPDWIIARSSDGVICALFLRLFRQLFRISTRVAVHSHGWEERVFETEKRLPIKILFPRTSILAHMIRFPLLRTALYASDCCITGTVAEVRWLGKRHPRIKDKFFYLPNGVDIGSYTVDQSENTMQFLSVGGNTWKKNISYTMGLFENIRKQHNDATITMVGLNQTGARKMSSESSQSISFIPEAAFNEMNTMYMHHKFLISSSRFEGGHSLAVLEAMSCGMVVFVAAIDSMREIVQDGKNGILITGVDIRADVKKICSVISDPIKRVSIGKQAQRSAFRHNWRRQSFRLERILNDEI
ncbi:MAG: glycosyltransferase family 4 protein [Chitinispirillaceae bacterium]